MIIKAFAKINLGIEVIGRRADGYHEIRTLFQTVDFHDTLEFSTLAKSEILLEGSDPSIPWDESNLIYRAAGLLKALPGVSGGIRIKVDKKIPAGMGLGGGSSDAAATLRALNEIWRLNLEKSDLHSLAGSLGADVPYFLDGGLCLGEGRGDCLTLLEDMDPFPLLLVLPDRPILTADVYGKLSSSLTSQGKVSKIIRFLDNRDFGILENDLEEAVFQILPHLEDIKREIQSHKAKLSLVSGSGSALFGLFHDWSTARNAAERLKAQGAVVLSKTITRERAMGRPETGV